VNTVPVPDELAAAFPTFRKVVVGSTTGKLDGDGSSPQEAFAIEALFGTDDDGYPRIREYWVPDSDERYDIERGCPIELVFWMPQMPVHAMNVQPFVVK
jgi:hypothetical protein